MQHLLQMNSPSRHFHDSCHLSPRSLPRPCECPVSVLPEVLAAPPPYSCAECFAVSVPIGRSAVTNDTITRPCVSSKKRSCCPPPKLTVLFSAWPMKSWR